MSQSILLHCTHQNASDVVVLARLLLFAEVSDDVEAELVTLAHDVEQERVGIVVQRLVVQKQLGLMSNFITSFFLLRR